MKFRLATKLNLFFFKSKVLTFLNLSSGTRGFYPIEFSENIINLGSPKKRYHNQLEKIYPTLNICHDLVYRSFCWFLFCFWFLILIYRAISVMKINNYTLQSPITMFRSVFKLLMPEPNQSALNNSMGFKMAFEIENIENNKNLNDEYL